MSPPVTLPEVSKQSATANCPARTHASGGGYTVSPLHDPSAGALGSYTQRSIFTGRRGWSVTTAAFSPGADTSSLVAVARCERKVDSKIAVRFAATRTVTPDTDGSDGYQATAITLNLTCPPQTRASAGGYDTDSTFANNPSGVTMLVIQNRRTARKVWTITAFLIGGPTAEPQDITVMGLCEASSRRRITTASRTVTYPEDARATATATCPKGRHLVSGGFLVSPLPAPGGGLSVPFIDHIAPVGNRGWRVDAYDSPLFGRPAGAALTTHAYCRRNKLPRRRRSASGAAATSSPPGTGRVEVQQVRVSIG
jgi:hypothetical protein